MRFRAVAWKVRVLRSEHLVQVARATGFTTMSKHLELLNGIALLITAASLALMSLLALP
jgi:hypothetical protein